jgi:hypothetical protein
LKSSPNTFLSIYFSSTKFYKIFFFVYISDYLIYFSVSLISAFGIKFNTLSSLIAFLALFVVPDLDLRRTPYSFTTGTFNFLDYLFFKAYVAGWKIDSSFFVGVLTNPPLNLKNSSNEFFFSWTLESLIISSTVPICLFKKY